MKHQRSLFLVIAAAVVFCCGLAPTPPQKPGALMTVAAEKLLATVSEEQRGLAVVDFDSDSRLKWHFIPMETRKGLELNLIKSESEKMQLVKAILQSALSDEDRGGGYKKAFTIMQLEN